MKSKLLFIFLLLTVTLSRTMADVVTPQTAALVARNFCYEQLLQDGVSINLNEIVLIPVTTREVNGLPVYYVFNLSTGGFIIISGEDAYTPVIGYNDQGAFPAGELAPHYSSFLAEFDDQIGFIRSNKVSQPSEIKSSWEYYQTMVNTRYIPGGNRDMEPLLPVIWNQDFPYNAYCPVDAGGSGGHVYAGCVATAMSMIMAYYRYPEHGTGSYSYNYGSYGNISANFGQTYYDWDAMLNSITSGSGRAINAIAELQFHCGVSVRMMYGPDGSGAYSEDVPYAIRSYFGYSSTAQHVRKSNYSASAWESMIVTSLDELKPLYYSGQSSEGGHAFVLDGYQTTGTGKLFHFNFGWSGSGNGFYTLTDVGGYSGAQAMVRNFFPNPANYPYNCDNHVITSPMGIFEDRSGPLANYQSNQTCTWLIAPEDSVTSITVNFTKFELAEGDVVNIYDGDNAGAALLATYDRNASITNLTSSGSRLFIEFLTDGNNTAQGFTAEFSSVYPVFCGGTITLSEPFGSFNDGSGDRRYNHNSLCKWKIDPGPYADQLTLAFTAFDLENDKDFLKVYAIPTNQLLANYTGSVVPEPLVSPTGKMLLLFTSNGFNNNQGFEAEYYIANVGTAQNDIVSELSIYPNPAKGYAEIRFNIPETLETGIIITDLTGRIVYREDQKLMAGFVHKVLQLNHLNSGVYMLTLQNEAGRITRKLILE